MKHDLKTNNFERKVKRIYRAFCGSIPQEQALSLDDHKALGSGCVIAHGEN